MQLETRPNPFPPAVEFAVAPEGQGAEATEPAAAVARGAGAEALGGRAEEDAAAAAVAAEPEAAAAAATVEEEEAGGAASAAFAKMMAEAQVRRLPTKPCRTRVGDRGWHNGRRAPTQDPSTNNRDDFVPAQAQVSAAAAATKKASAAAAAAAAGTAPAARTAGDKCCLACGKAPRRLKVCSKCRSAWFCDRECQLQCHPSHKEECKRVSTKLKTVQAQARPPGASTPDWAFPAS